VDHRNGFDYYLTTEKDEKCTEDGVVGTHTHMCLISILEVLEKKEKGLERCLYEVDI
jgi:hypothetical protein